jgi:hypothetical protein
LFAVPTVVLKFNVPILESWCPRAPARVEVDGKKMTVPGCKIFVGGQIGEDAHLAMEPIKTGIPLAEESLIPELAAILKSEIGASIDK